MLEVPPSERRKRTREQHSLQSDTGRRGQIHGDADKSTEEEAVVGSIRCCRETREDKDAGERPRAEQRPLDSAIRKSSSFENSFPVRV